MVFRNYLVFILGIILLLLKPVSAEPERIISLGAAISEELYLLGAGERLVGNTIYCNRPEAARKKEKVGTVTNVNVEKIVSLKPDVVFATSLTDKRQVEKLKKLKINVIEITQERDFKGICANFLKVGTAIGKRLEARNIIEEAQAKVTLLCQKTLRLSQPKVMAQIGASPLFVANRQYFIHDFIEMAGGINIAKDTPAGQYSREEALKQNPDIIIIATMGITGEQEKIIWQGYPSLNAAKNQKIYIIDSDKLCSVTPVSFVETLQEIIKILHPELGNG